MIDKIGYKILAQLDRNSRQHSSEISRAIGIPRHVVDYRIKKMISDGYIRSFPAFIDPCKFGLTGWKVYLQLKGTNTRIENEMFDYLQSAPNIWWAVKCFGSYDLLYLPLAKNFYEVNKHLCAFHDKFGQYIVKEDINNHLEPVYFSRGYLSRDEPVALCDPAMRKPENLQVDKFDVDVLKLLGSNSRLSSVEIARKINSTPRVVNYRIKELVKNKIISFFRLGLNLEKFNLEFYKGLLYLSSTREQDLLALYEYARLNPHISECVKAVGPWQMEIELEIPNFRKFADVALDIKAKFPGLVNRIEPLLLYNERKPDFNFLDQYDYKKL